MIKEKFRGRSRSMSTPWCWKAGVNEHEISEPLAAVPVPQVSEHIVDVTVPPLFDEAGCLLSSGTDRSFPCAAGGRAVADAQVPQFLDEVIEVMKLDPQERVQEPTVEHAPVCHSREEIGEVVKLVSQD